MSFIQIVAANVPFPWRPEHEDGTQSGTEIMLQVLDDDVLASLRKKHNHLIFKHGQRVDDFDSSGFTNDVVDKAIVSWKGVTKAGTDDELPCERAIKVQLPERLKIEIVRLCAGKEAGRLFGEAVAEGKKP